MNMNGENNTIYRVLVNGEEQYSIWPEYKDIPAGWQDVGQMGPKEQCLEYIDKTWTDMRPLSLRKAMAAEAAEKVTGSTPPLSIG
jgi:MbtH protein